MPNESNKRWNGLGVAIIVAIVLPVLYVLSIGPAAWLAQHGVFIREMVEIIYTPLVIVAMQSEATHELLLDYIDFWIA